MTWRLMIGAGCAGYLVDGVHGALIAVVAVVGLELVIALVSFTIGRPS